jgi:Fur family ferric uptake transcriptional regulator
MADGTLKEFETFLAGQGLRLTGQRRLIAQTFFRKAGHHSAEEIYLQVKKTHPGIGSATVYRTMKLLRDAGLATGMNIGDGFARYEPATGKGHHDHLICRDCGKIVEFENDQIETLQTKVARRHGFSVTSHKMELYGVCGGCRKEAKRSRGK